MSTGFSRSMLSPSFSVSRYQRFYFAGAVTVRVFISSLAFIFSFANSSSRSQIFPSFFFGAKPLVVGVFSLSRRTTSNTVGAFLIEDYRLFLFCFDVAVNLEIGVEADFLDIIPDSCDNIFPVSLFVKFLISYILCIFYLVLTLFSYNKIYFRY